MHRTALLLLAIATCFAVSACGDPVAPGHGAAPSSPRHFAPQPAPMPLTGSPCPAPQGDTADLFQMIDDPSTSPATIEYFLEAHQVDPRSRNQLCQTLFVDDILGKRSDVFTVLYDHYVPDPSSDDFGSIYLTILRSGTGEIYRVLEDEVKRHNQTLTLPDTSPTPLVVAAEAGNVHVLKHMLHEGANANETDISGASVLMLAVEQKDNADVVEALLSDRANPNAIEPTEGLSVLMLASKQPGNIEVIRALLKAGAKKDTRDHHGETAQDIARENHAPDDVLKLLGA